MSDVMMALGPFVFGVNGAAYQQLTTKSAMRWEKQDRLGRTPALQLIGADSETIELSGVIFPGFRAGTAETVDELRDLMSEGEPLELVDGSGFAWGRYVVEDVEDVYTFMHSNGIPRKIEFTLHLRLYGDDEVDEGSVEFFDTNGDGFPDNVPDDAAAMMSVRRYGDPALTSGGNNGLSGVLAAITLARSVAADFPGAIAGRVGGSLGVALSEEGALVLTGEAGIGVNLGGFGSVGLVKSQSVTLYTPPADDGGGEGG